MGSELTVISLSPIVNASFPNKFGTPLPYDVSPNLDHTDFSIDISGFVLILAQWELKDLHNSSWAYTGSVILFVQTPPKT